MNRKRLSVAAVAAAALAALVAALLGTGSANAASSATVLRLTSGGTTSLNVTGSTSRVDGTSQETTDAEVDEDVPGSGNSASRVPSSGVPAPAANAVTATGSELVKGFAGLNHADQRFSGTGQYAGTNFSLEPPDQALCVGGGYVVESVNDAIRAYTTSGAAVTSAVALNQFFKLSPGIVRGATPVYGDFTSDPKCLYDNGHFYVTILQAGTVKSTGDFDGTGHVEIAVSRTSDPTGAWSLYSIDNANDSGDCPCLGDQPLIGADANGFYVTTNSFPFFDDGFNGAQVYAISKSQLEAGASSVNVVKVPVVAPAGFDGTPYTLQPAKAAPGTANAFNTEYFLSALDFNATLDNRIAVWSLTGTSTLNSASPNLTLTGKVLDSQVYGQPPAAQQSSDGVFPLRDGLLGLSVQQALYGVQWDNGTYHTELLNSNDDRMNEVIYAGGKL
jgi:hypothetical protein